MGSSKLAEGVVVSIDGQELRRLRKILGLTLGDLALAARTTKATLSLVERNERQASLAWWRRAVGALAKHGFSRDYVACRLAATIDVAEEVERVRNDPSRVLDYAILQYARRSLERAGIDADELEGGHDR